jgi:nicotinate-nucleotide adenylyltransferase
MNSGARLGILGGTLDPVHLGHVEAAIAARDALALDRVLLVPSHIPPHRLEQPVGPPFHRFAMCAIAVNGRDRLEASDIELAAPGPSYTADTLARFHAAGFHASQIFFITGMDAFVEIETWKRYPDVLDLANFVVVSRPGYDTDVLTERLPSIQGRLASAESPRASSTSTGVYVVSARTPDLSSTEIRRRLRAGESVRGLIDPGVEQHIRQHRLYVGSSSPLLLHNTADHLHGQN